MNQDSLHHGWRRIAHILQSTDRGMGLQRVFPADQRRVSLCDGLADAEVYASREQAADGRELHAQLTGILQQLSVNERLSRCPILAITGMLNSGKSSLLASYLTPENRGRVLRGLDNQAGTHRFVIWLPSVWRDDPELLSTMVGFLSSLFGHPPEELSQDAQQAAAQYNGRIVESLVRVVGASTEESACNEESAQTSVDSLSVPLIAYDEGLNTLRMGLLDCPDIQTGFHLGSSRSATGELLAAERRLQLARIGRLCSAFIVMCKLNSLHDEGLLQILSTLRDSMPGVPRLLAINKIKGRYTPQVVVEQARGLMERFGLSSVYGAYDFRSQLARAQIPALPTGMRANGDELPIFFDLSATNQSTQRPAPLAAETSYLFHLSDRLEPGELSAASTRSLNLQLKARSYAALQWYESNQRFRQQQIQDAWRAIADACYEFMAERDSTGKPQGLRLQTSPAIISQMADSLNRTAPLWMRMSLRIDRTARQLHQAIRSSAAGFKILESASKSVTQFAQRFKRGEGAQVVTPERLAAAIRGCDSHDAFQAVIQGELERASETAIKRFAKEDMTRLDHAELDLWSRQVWGSMSFKDKLWKSTQPLAVIMAPLLAAVLVPIDGGGTAVLVFASAKELLAAAGIAAVMAPMATGGETLSIVHRETPWRQLSDLFAVVCDSLGVPRPIGDDLPLVQEASVRRRLLTSRLETRTESLVSAVYRWELVEDGVLELRSLLQQLN